MELMKPGDQGVREQPLVAQHGLTPSINSLTLLVVAMSSRRTRWSGMQLHGNYTVHARVCPYGDKKNC
jgi:hypothetical protein